MRLIIALILAVVSLLPLCGCAGREISVALKSYTATTDYLSSQREAGKIPDDVQRNIIAPAREASKAILDEMFNAYIEGRQFNWRASLVRFYEAMGPLLRVREVMEGANETAD